MFSLHVKNPLFLIPCVEAKYQIKDKPKITDNVENRQVTWLEVLERYLQRYRNALMYNQHTRNNVPGGLKTTLRKYGVLFFLHPLLVYPKVILVLIICIFNCGRITLLCWRFLLKKGKTLCDASESLQYILSYSVLSL